MKGLPRLRPRAEGFRHRRGNPAVGTLTVATTAFEAGSPVRRTPDRIEEFDCPVRLKLALRLNIVRPSNAGYHYCDEYDAARRLLLSLKHSDAGRMAGDSSFLHSKRRSVSVRFR